MPCFSIRAAALAILLVVATPAVADTIVCTDADGQARVEVGIVFADPGRDAGEVTRVDGRFLDFTISTESADPDRRPEVLVDPVSTDDRLEVFLLDPDEVRIVLALRLFRDFRTDGTDREYTEHVVAGTLRAMGAGVWAVTCTGW